MKSFVALSLFLSLLLSGGLRADAGQAAPGLFELVPGKVAAGAATYSPRGTVDEHAVRADRTLLERNPARLSFPLPDGRVVTASRSHSARLASGGIRWSGELDDADLGGGAAGIVRLVLKRGRLLGTVRTADGQVYRLLPQGELHRLVHVEEPAGHTCGLESFPHDGAGEEGGATSFDKVGSDTDCYSQTTVVTIDLMVLYPRALEAYAQDVEDYAVAMEEESNEIFDNSEVNIQYNLVHVGLITGEQPPAQENQSPTATPLHTQLARNWLTDQFATSTVDTEVEMLRKAYGADMIALVVDEHPNNNCGIANLPKLVSGNEVIYDRTGVTFGDKAFMAVELECGLADYTFAHELGHTFGMRHDDTARDGTELYPWSYGYIVPTVPTQADVMGCAQITPTVDCRRIAHFSNPDTEILKNVFVGVHSSQAPTPPAFNACVANLRAAQYGNFAQAPASTPPTVTITSPADLAAVTLGSSVTLVATASDAQDGNLSSSVQWSSDLDGSLGTGASRTVTLSQGVHVITAKVTDASGTSLLYGIRLKVVPVVTISATDAETSETATNPGQVRLTRTGSTAGTLEVHLSFGGSATGGSDYSTISTTQTFSSGQSTKDVAVTAINDATVEDVETVIVSVATDPESDYTVGSPSSATVSITNNDFTACTPSSTRLCLQSGRFEATLSATVSGTPYTGQAVSLTDSTGAFWLFSSNNLEVGVKVLDAGSIDGNMWAFHGAATDVAYTVTVTDRANMSRVRTLTKSAGGYQGGADFTFFDKSAGPAEDASGEEGAPVSMLKSFTCTPDATTTCLLGNRFQVRLKRGSVYQEVVQANSQTGFFWFFDDDNLEVFVKLLDGTSINGKYWVFFGSMTDEAYTIEVTDSVTGTLKSYTDPGDFYGGGDTTAF